MQQLRVVDLAHTMGITPRELIFKLRSIGVTVASEEDTLDLSTVRSIITGETLQRRPREVIVRREKPTEESAALSAKDRMARRRRRLVVDTEKEIHEVVGEKKPVETGVETGVEADVEAETEVTAEAAAEEVQVEAVEAAPTVDETEVEAAVVEGIPASEAPEEHIGPKVPVVTTSISWAALFIPFLAAISITSSAVTTTALPFFIFSFISAMVLSIFLQPVWRILPEIKGIVNLSM